jgi:hypothetical protein
MLLCFFFLEIFWELKCFNQKWLHHHQLESYSKRYPHRTSLSQPLPVASPICSPGAALFFERAPLERAHAAYDHIVSKDRGIARVSKLLYYCEGNGWLSDAWLGPDIIDSSNLWLNSCSLPDCSQSKNKCCRSSAMPGQCGQLGESMMFLWCRFTRSSFCLGVVAILKL